MKLKKTANGGVSKIITNAIEGKDNIWDGVATSAFTGSSIGVADEWIFHNIAYNVGDIFGVQTLAQQGQHLSVGATIYDDMTRRTGMSLYASKGMIFFYVYSHPVFAIFDNFVE